MIQILHYYCKPHKADLLNNITYPRGISCQIQTGYIDISDIVKELNNKMHIDCIVIDDELFGTMPEAEDIVSKLEVLKYVTENTEILIIALDRNQNDDIIAAIHKNGVADCIITKDMSERFESIVAEYFDGAVNSIVSNSDIEVQYTNGNVAESEIFKQSTDNEELNVPVAAPEIINDSVEVDTAEETKLDTDGVFETYDNSMITIGVCGLQPHIGATHHALAIAKAIANTHKRVCYKENNNHCAYNVLQTGGMAVEKAGYISMAGIDIFNENTDIIPDKYSFCVIDFGYIGECYEADFFDTDIPVIIAGAKDWEIHHFIGAYQSGTLEKANILMNFFPMHEQLNFKNAFPTLNIWFSEYAPEVFDPQNNVDIYKQIINN